MKTYGFCAITSYNNLSKGRLILTKHNYDIEEWVTPTIGIYVEVTDGVTLDDMNRIEEIPLNMSTDSYQIRVKAVYKNKKGYYVKANKIEYLDDVTISSMLAIFKDIKVSN